MDYFKYSCCQHAGMYTHYCLNVNFPIWRSIRFYMVLHVFRTVLPSPTCQHNAAQDTPMFHLLPGTTATEVSTILEDLGQHLESKITHTALTCARWLQIDCHNVSISALSVVRDEATRGFLCGLPSPFIPGRLLSPPSPSLPSLPLWEAAVSITSDKHRRGEKQTILPLYLSVQRTLCALC